MKKAFIFDFDDTLATTNCRVHVRRVHDSSLHRELTPFEYSGYELASDEYFDYIEFRDPTFIEKAEKLEMMKLAKEVHDEKHDVFILTARGSAVADAINSFLLDYGIHAKQIHCIGDRDRGNTIATEKARILSELIAKYDKLYFYDDNENNVKLAKEVGVKSYLV